MALTWAMLKTKKTYRRFRKMTQSPGRCTPCEVHLNEYRTTALLLTTGNTIYRILYNTYELP